MGIFSRKPEAVDHNTGSAIGTALWEGTKGAVLGALAITLGSALVMGAGALLLGSASVGTWTLAGLVGGAALSLTPIGWGTSGIFAALGGLFGLARGGSRISREKSEFNRQVSENFQSRQQALALQQNEAFNRGMTAGYITAAQDTQQLMANSKVETELQKRANTTAAPNVPQPG